MNYLRPVEVPPSHPDHSGLVDGLKDFKGANYIVVGESPLEFRVHAPLASALNIEKSTHQDLMALLEVGTELFGVVKATVLRGDTTECPAEGYVMTQLGANNNGRRAKLSDVPLSQAYTIVGKNEPHGLELDMSVSDNHLFLAITEQDSILVGPGNNGGHIAVVTANIAGEGFQDDPENPLSGMMMWSAPSSEIRQMMLSQQED